MDSKGSSEDEFLKSQLLKELVTEKKSKEEYNLEDKVQQTRNRLKLLREDLELYEDATKSTIFRLEYLQAKRMRPWQRLIWMAMVCLTLLCTFGTYSSGSFLLTALNFIGFLCVWRGLNVAENTKHMVVAGVIAVGTIKFS